MTTINALPPHWSGYTTTLGDLRLFDITNNGRVAAGIVSSKPLKTSFAEGTRTQLNLPIFLYDASKPGFESAVTEPVIYRDGQLMPLQVPTINGFRSGYVAFISGAGDRVYGAVASGTRTISGLSGYPSPAQMLVWNAGYWTLDGAWHSLNTGPDTYPIGASANGDRVMVADCKDIPIDIVAKRGVVLTRSGSQPFEYRNGWVSQLSVDGDGVGPRDEFCLGGFCSWWISLRSRDGSTEFGQDYLARPNNGRFRWRASSATWMGLGYNSSALGSFADATADGSAAIIADIPWPLLGGDTFEMWSETDGLKTAHAWFAERGITLPPRNIWFQESFVLYAACDRFRFFTGRVFGSASSFIIDLGNKCPADIDVSYYVDDDDFSVFAPAYDLLDCTDPAMASGCPADLNRDGLVDDADFSIFVVAYDQLVCP